MGSSHVKVGILIADASVSVKTTFCGDVNAPAVGSVTGSAVVSIVGTSQDEIAQYSIYLTYPKQ